MNTNIASRASDFIQSIGVCAHIDDSSSSYATSPVAQQMAYLGISNMRVEAPYANLSTYTALGKAGIKFDVISSTTNLQQQIGFLNSISSYVAFAEGPNEVNTSPVSYQGLSGAAAAIAYQKDFYAAVHADPLLKGVAVLFPSAVASQASATSPPTPTTATCTATPVKACRPTTCSATPSAASPPRPASRRS